MSTETEVYQDKQAPTSTTLCKQQQKSEGQSQNVIESELEDGNTLHSVDVTFKSNALQYYYHKADSYDLVSSIYQLTFYSTERGNLVCVQTRQQHLDCHHQRW